MFSFSFSRWRGPSAWHAIGTSGAWFAVSRDLIDLLLVSVGRKIDEEFKAELKELIFLLINHSQTEPYFAHLAQALQGDETII